MKTYLECIPCFFKQALDTARMVTSDPVLQKKIMDEVAGVMPDFSLDSTPPEMARYIYKIIRKEFGECDPYKAVKEKSNSMSMGLYPKLKEKVENAEDRLLIAVEIAIAGNVIDYGAKNSLNIKDELEKLLNNDFDGAGKTIFDYESFKKDLSRAQKILYLADNAGEVVFDKILIEELSKEKEVTYVVRGAPIINDALEEDAYVCGIGEKADIISSGVDAPGTILKYCSEEFIKIYNNAEFVISKGQGNYEALTDEKKRIYFLFKAKCPVIALHAGAEVGDIVLKKCK